MLIILIFSKQILLELNEEDDDDFNSLIIVFEPNKVKKKIFSHIMFDFIIYLLACYFSE